MRAFHQKKTAEKDGSPLRLALLALALTVTMELFNHKAFSEGPAPFWAFLAKRPLAAAVDYLLVLLTLLPTLFARRRTFWQTLLSVVWLGVGAANGFILLNRMTPFTIADLTVLNTGLDTLPNYLSPGYILLLAAAVAAALAGLTVLFWKGKRCPLPWKQRAKAGLLSTAAAAAALAGTWALAFHTHQLSAEFANLAYAYEDYGLPYCFLQTWLNKGIRCPAGYSSAAMDRVAGMIGEETPVNMGEPQTDVNVVFVQLESFFRPERLKGLPEGECDLPVFSSLLANCPSGGLTVPVFGGGTVNTEFEVLTGMSVRDFGTGEFPYHTVLQNMPCESICYNLRELGYTSHAIHDNTAIFYNRFKVFANLGFDTFTSIEYMNGVTYNPIGWAKDKTMLPYVTEALDSTDGPDFIQVITVQPHGSYPDDEDLPPADLDAEGFEEEDARRAFAYYLTQLEEEDAFIGELIRGLSARSEPIVVVLYGDHLPAFAITDDMLLDGDVYRSEYAIWSNFDLGGEKKDLSAYQLSAYVMELLGFDNGLLTRLHQHYMQEGEDYAETLKLLEYDMIYGEQTVYGGEFPYKPTDLHMGLSEITVDSLRAGEKILSVYGENFTKSSYVYVNGDRKHTEFVSPGELLALASAEAGDLVTVAQLSNGEPVGETEPCLVELDERDEG